jgi:hypothetical protein
VRPPAVAVNPRDLVGKYDLSGTNPDGTTYEGTATIEFAAGNSVTITYKIGRRNDVGVGKVEGNKLIVTYQGAVVNRKGGAEYVIRKNGKLEGTWRDKGEKKGTETLTPK